MLEVHDVRLGFGRPSLCGSLDNLRRPGDDLTEAAFNKTVLCSPMTVAGVTVVSGFSRTARAGHGGKFRHQSVAAISCHPCSRRAEAFRSNMVIICSTRCQS
jgi:hypothetical protein